jgi:hypothetical protein
MGRWNSWVQSFFAEISRLLVSVWTMEPCGIMGCKVKSSLPMTPFKYDLWAGAFSVLERCGFIGAIDQ